MGQWRHICGTYDGHYIRLYLNGVVDANTPYSGSITTNDQRVCIGRNQETSNKRYWDGLIDDVRVFNRALNESEIGIVRDGGTVSSGLVGHWKFDEPGSITITAEPEKAAILVGAEGEQEKWSPAGGAFYRSIERR